MMTSHTAEQKSHNFDVQGANSDEIWTDNKDVKSFSSPHIYALSTKTPATDAVHAGCMRWTVYGTALIVLTFGLLYLCREYVRVTLFWLEHTDRWLSFLVFACLFVLVSLVIAWGYVVLNIAAGYLYGFCLGLGVVSVCAAAGVVTSHVLTRRCCQGFVQRRVAGAGLKALLRVVEGERGFRIIALARLTPIPFGLQNGLFAISSVRPSTYILASICGLLPTQCLNTYLGSTLRSMEEVIVDGSRSYIVYLVFCTQMSVAILLSMYVIRHAKLELRRAMEDEAFRRLTRGSFSDSSSESDVSPI